MQSAKVVSQEEWLAARRALLVKEKAHMRDGDALAAERRALPWVKVEKAYGFDTAERAQVPGRAVRRPQPADRAPPDVRAGVERRLPRLLLPGRAHRRAGAAPRAARREHRRRLARAAGQAAGLQGAHGVALRVGVRRRARTSTATSGSPSRRTTSPSGRIDYNFGTIKTDPRYLDRELPGVSVFRRDEAGEVFHTYSTYARGLDALLGANHYLDLTPEGRNDGAHPNWPRRRDEY